jgi:hypothetical protein
MESKNISTKSAEIDKFLKKGYEEIEAKRWEYALIVFEKVLSISKGNKEALAGILETHKAHANDEIANGNWSEAIKTADTILGIAKDNPFPYIIKILANCYKKELDSEIFLDLFFISKAKSDEESSGKRKSKERNKIKYQSIIKLYDSVLLYADEEFKHTIEEKAKEAIYGTVCEHFDKLEIDKAEALLPYIKNYRDIAEKTEDAKYNHACKLATEGQCALAKKEFEKLGGYKDSGNRAYLCESYSDLDKSAQEHLKSYAKDIADLKNRATRAQSKKEFKIHPFLQFFLMAVTVVLVVFGFVGGYYFALPSPISIVYLVASVVVFIGLICTIYPKSSMFHSLFPDYNWGKDPEGDVSYFAGIAIMGFFLALTTPVTSIMGLVGFLRDFLTAKKEIRKVSEETAQFQDKLKYLLETMIGDEIETFESDAESVGFMQGYGKALIEKYSKIQFQ